MSVVVATRDLMTGSRLAGAGQLAGVEVRSVITLPALTSALAEGAVRLVLIDLAALPADLGELVRAAKQHCPAPAVIAFGPHVQSALLDAARDAGCDDVLTRGQLHAGAAELLRRYAGEAAAE